MGSSYPPVFQPTIRVMQKVRFQSTGTAATRNLTFTELLDLFCVATSATSAYRLAQAVRVVRLEMWAMAATSNGVAQISASKFSSGNGAGGDNIKYADTAIGFDRPAHIVLNFSQKEQVGQWQNSTQTAAYAQLTFVAGTIVELTFEISLYEDGLVQAVASAVSGAITGALAVRALDNSNASPGLIPVAYYTI